MTLSELFKFNKNIVINTDIDGFLSGMILQKYYGCRVVGFTDSAKSLWISPEVVSIKDPIYIDLYVVDPDVVCIENHIISYDSIQTNEIKSLHRLMGYYEFRTKWNPNLERNRNCQDNYIYKYPFGTVHYLIALMAQDNIHVRLDNLSKEIIIQDIWTTFRVTPGMILLRADDALNSSLIKYKENCRDWWQWLEDTFNSQAIFLIKEYLYSLNSEFDYNRNILDRFFLDYLKCDGKDGSFKKDSVRNNQDGVSDRIKEYTKKISEIFGLELDLPQKLDYYEGRDIQHFNVPSRYKQDDIRDLNIFSYAYVYRSRLRCTIGPMIKK